MPLLVEGRIAYTFHLLGLTPQYEYPAGSGTKSVDFLIQANPDWLIEVVSLRESNAVKEATQESGILSEEGEILRAMEHIADKAEKFPEPAPTALHVILVDTRGYLIGMGYLANPRLFAWRGPVYFL
jgi:hypothetical protein